jgi:DNA repair exonuclease SbcCD ATPase subunit
MGRNLSLLSRLPRLEEDGETHRRDCSCARCDAGYGPSEAARREALRRWGEAKARKAAARVIARRKEEERLKQAETEQVLDEQVRAADERLRALRQLDERLRQDERLAELWRLRREGLTLGAAMDEVDRRFPAPAA